MVTTEVTFSADDLLSSMHLWEPQQAAVQKMRQYISAYRKGEVKQAALVHMPTGSGKSGVIAVLTRCLPEIDCALVLTPRVPLRQQLHLDVAGRFFEHLTPRVDITTIPKKIIEIDEVAQVDDIKDLSSTVVITTIQMIHNLSKGPERNWKEFIEKIDLVIIDEGHCEPATSWSQAIRDFQAPKIIFTATPFRNDLKVFEIDTAEIYSYTFHDAQRDHILREVEFIPMPATKDPNEFVDALLKFYDDKFGKVKGPRPRVIIRCDHHQEIRLIESVLIKKGRSCIAIHETFTSRDVDCVRIVRLAS